MGNVNICCQPSVNNSLPVGYKSSYFEMQFEPSDSDPKITNENILNRLSQLESRPLSIDQSKHPKAKELMAMKEKNKGFIYSGQWINNKPDGYGKIFFTNGEYFQGQFIQGKAAGPGRYIFQNGDYYEGNIDDNSARGKGVYESKQVRYEGLWEDSKPSIGKYTLQNGVEVNMEHSHYGTITWLDGRSYHGQIGRDLNPGGQGEMRFPNGNTYDGNWMDGVMNGYGTYSWKDGKKYKGQYVNGVKEGPGTFYFNDEDWYEGSWAKGKQHGQGKLYKKKELVFEGMFEDGKPTKQADKPKAEEQAEPLLSKPIQAQIPGTILQSSELKNPPVVPSVALSGGVNAYGLDQSNEWKSNPDPWNINPPTMTLNPVQVNQPILNKQSIINRV